MVNMILNVHYCIARVSKKVNINTRKAEKKVCFQSNVDLSRKKKSNTKMIVVFVQREKKYVAQSKVVRGC